MQEFIYTLLGALVICPTTADEVILTVFTCPVTEKMILLLPTKAINVVSKHLPKLYREHEEILQAC